MRQSQQLENAHFDESTWGEEALYRRDLKVTQQRHSKVVVASMVASFVSGLGTSVFSVWAVSNFAALFDNIFWVASVLALATIVLTGMVLASTIHDERGANRTVSPSAEGSRPSPPPEQHRRSGRER